MYSEFLKWDLRGWAEESSPRNCSALRRISDCQTRRSVWQSDLRSLEVLKWQNKLISSNKPECPLFTFPNTTCTTCKQSSCYLYCVNVFCWVFFVLDFLSAGQLTESKSVKASKANRECENTKWKHIFEHLTSDSWNWDSWLALTAVSRLKLSDYQTYNLQSDHSSALFLVMLKMLLS